MSYDLHTVSVNKASSALAMSDRIAVLLQKQVANAAGGSAGASVTVALTGLELPASYAVFVSPGQDATWWISSRTQAGFTVNLSPRLAANTLAAGSIDILVLA